MKHDAEEWWAFRVDMALEEAEDKAGRPLTEEERLDVIASVEDWQEYADLD